MGNGETEDRSVDTVDTSGLAFIEFWSRVAARGDMNPNTAASLRAAAKAVMEIEDGWEQLDVRSLDVENFLRRFANKKGPEFKVESLRQYQRRFRQAYESFLQYAENPAAWKPPAQSANGAGRRETKKVRPTVRTVTTEASEEDEPASGFGTTASGVEYPFPLRGGAFMAKLRLPTDLTQDEADVLHVFLKALANATAAKSKAES